jgi:transposase-like protein
MIAQATQALAITATAAQGQKAVEGVLNTMHSTTDAPTLLDLTRAFRAMEMTAAGEHLFTFARLPPSQWKSARTTNAIERLHEELKRRIKTQTVLPSAETARHAVLGAARFRADQHAEGGRLADPRHETHRSAD